jgi:hypothetical protein
MEHVSQNLKILIAILQPVFTVFLLQVEASLLQCIAIAVKSSVANTQKDNAFILRLGVAVRKKKDKPEYSMGFSIS